MNHLVMNSKVCGCLRKCGYLTKIARENGKHNDEPRYLSGTPMANGDFSANVALFGMI